MEYSPKNKKGEIKERKRLSHITTSIFLIIVSIILTVIAPDPFVGIENAKYLSNILLIIGLACFIIFNIDSSKVPKIIINPLIGIGSLSFFGTILFLVYILDTSKIFLFKFGIFISFFVLFSLFGLFASLKEH